MASGLETRLDASDEPEVALFQEEYVLPMNAFLSGINRRETERVAVRGVGYAVFLFFFVISTSWTRPVSSTFEVQRGVAQSLVEQPIDLGGASRKRNFHAISSPSDFWAWVQTVLFRQVYNSSMYNTFNRSGMDEFVIAKYNRLITPIRFRQLRSKRDKCASDPEAHTFARPCWTTFSSSVDEMNFPFPQSEYFAEGLSALASDQALGSTYGTGGHVVDFDLNAVQAGQKLQNMLQLRWTDEWTRTIAVDVNTYNPTYDVATAFRFQIDQDIGGRIETHVEVSSCPLSPYTGPTGAIQLTLELVWLICLVAYTVDAAVRWCRRGTLVYLFEDWGCVEMLCVACFVIIIAVWCDYLGRDRSMFQAPRTEFEDLHSLCSRFNFATRFAGFSVVWAFMHAVHYLKLHMHFRVIWQALSRSLRAVVPFAGVLLCGVIAFTFSGHWLFGTQVHDFRTWPRTFGFLFQSMVAGLTSKKDGQLARVLDMMAEANPAMASAWTMVWVLVSELVIFNMFVAILVNSFMHVVRCANHRRELESAAEGPSWELRLRSRCVCLWRDPDTVEQCQKQAQEEWAWKKYLGMVDPRRLEAAVQACLARGAYNFEARDAMKLFPHKSDAESYRNAVAWMKGLAADVGIKMRRMRCKESTMFETRILMDRLHRLEEEALGLTLQLRGVLPHAPRAEPI